MRKRVFGLLATAAIVFAACGTAATPAPTAAPPTAAPATPAPATPAPTAAAPSGPDLTTTVYAPEPAATTGGTLVIAEWQFPDTFNIYYAQAFTDNEAAAAFSNGLLNLSDDLKYVPDLAKNVPQVANGGVTIVGDGMDVDWQLKEGMKWSDGQPITCDDVTATWNWIMDPANTGLAGGTVGWDQITGIDAKSPTECIVHYKALYSGYLSLMSPILPAHYISKIPVADAVTKLYPLADPTSGVYSGPYIPSEVKTDAQITLVPNPNWATISGHAPYLDKVIWKYYGDADAMIAGYRAGEVDLTNNLAQSDLPKLTDLPQDQVRADPALVYEVVAINWKRFYAKYGVDAPVVMKAIKMIIDKTAIAAGPLQGTVEPSNNFVSPLAWYVKDQGAPPAADPAGAEKLLQGAGFVKDETGIYAKNGQQIAVDQCTTLRQVRIDTQTLIASQLQAAGIRGYVWPKPSNPDVFGGWNAVPADTLCNIVHGNFDIAEFAYISPLDPVGSYNVYHSKGIPDAPPHNGQNVTRVSIPEIDAAYDIVNTSVDFAKIADAMGAIQDIYGNADKNTFEDPLYFRKDVWLHSPKLHNFVGNPSTASGEWNIGDFWLSQ